MPVRNFRFAAGVLSTIAFLTVPGAASAGDEIFSNGFDTGSVEYWSADVGYPCPVFRGPASDLAEIDGSAPNRYIAYYGLGDAGPVYNNFLVTELYEDYGGPMGTANIDLGAGDEANYDTCGTCMLLLYQYQPGVGWEKILFQRSGSLNITELTPSVGGTYSATLDAVLEEVTLDENAHSTPVPGGCIAPIHSFSYSEVLVAAP